MKVILLGATGMVGQGVLRECLLDPGVERVLAVGRSASGVRLRDLVIPDLFDLSPRLGRAMLAVVKRGAPRRVVATRDINELARDSGARSTVPTR